MRNLRTFLLISLCCAGLMQAQKVTYNYDRTRDFSKYHTYKWVTIEGSSKISQITAQNIVSSVNGELARKGFAPAPEGQNADFLVGYQASIDHQQQINWYNTGGGYWRYGGGMSMGSADVTTIPIGTLVVDCYDPGEKHLIWRGTATKTLDPNAKPDKSYENLQKAVAKLLKDFPPPAKK